ncbi:MAG: DUF2635 domain-containing protein [Pseudodesulfovibrio sp.]|uniref:DUF2635 domain-containing protein n=1 Tax=Pseudodesulfovibrio aespoeensis (strain ATCC 700646 / DSM 10631 / Aspo-2) TaxID=643562 RepID=E6VU95_PSEA9|nr:MULTISPECIES: DUF2635 domain-containing protein [Pseudodesulfovibrio]ADU63402.1 hypothetical protein Daes_2397 [Pseudodesulfovibrio aespoeensis Aspo-2]MBV1766483.1 DUF2635 domain-containing protein [Pseudodesulfovibrio sp.]MBV1772781.1 DUF2635 domain-containing protein [Pseudodesulfovibrio sp.]MCG2732518.1 DUF2635 domain-containing protein [Pseudodesulfovibrio aespoeensis]
MQNIFVQPAPGRQVRAPRTGQAVPAQGAIVPATTYWHRRLRDGDVVLSTGSAIGQAKAKTKTDKE